VIFATGLRQSLRHVHDRVHDVVPISRRHEEIGLDVASGHRQPLAL